MENNIAQFIILFVIVGISYGCQKLVRSNPEMISGFHWGETDEEKERDRAWLNLFSRSMGIANLITLIGGVLSILFFSFLFLGILSYLLFLFSHLQSIGPHDFNSSWIIDVFGSKCG